MNNDLFFNIALKEANKASISNNVPVGAVIVRNNKIISKAYNKKNSMNISIYHAEVLAIIKACKKLKTWILDDCTIYVTLEPCEMCKRAIAESRIKDIKYLVSSNYFENSDKHFQSIDMQMYSDINAIKKYEEILSLFFKKIRKK